MTKLQMIELCCPVCDNRFQSRAVEAADSPAGKRTDFHEQWPGRPPLPYLVHMLIVRLQSQSRLLPGSYSAVRERSLLSQLASLAQPTRRRIREVRRQRRGLNAGGLAALRDLWLRAAWCCVDEWT